MTTPTQTLIDALRNAQRAINSMKNEAETAAQLDEPAMLEALEEISNQGLAADMAIRAVLSTSTQQAATGAKASDEVARIVHLRTARDRRIYIAGPMTGLPEYNFPAFNAKAAELRAEGWHVENPAEHGHVEGAGWADYLRWDISRIATCGALYLLPGWEKSKGAALEVTIGQTLGLSFMGEQAAAKSAAPAAVTGGLSDPEIDEAWAITNSEGGAVLGWRRFAHRLLALAKAKAATQAPAAVVLTIEAVATVVRKEGDLDLRWLIEGGIAAMAEGETLMICAERLTDDTGSGEVYRSAPMPAGAAVVPRGVYGPGDNEGRPWGDADWIAKNHTAVMQFLERAATTPTTGGEQS